LYAQVSQVTVSFSSSATSVLTHGPPTITRSDVTAVVSMSLSSLETGSVILTAVSTVEPPVVVVKTGSLPTATMASAYWSG
jgi:hypothetical protein